MERHFLMFYSSENGFFKMFLQWWNDFFKMFYSSEMAFLMFWYSTCSLLIQFVCVFFWTHKIKMFTFCLLPLPADVFPWESAANGRPGSAEAKAAKWAGKRSPTHCTGCSRSFRVVAVLLKNQKYTNILFFYEIKYLGKVWVNGNIYFL